MARNPPDAATERLLALVRQYLREPSGGYVDTLTGDPVIEFEPPLSAQEQTTYARLVRIAKNRVLGISPAEFQALEPDIDGLRTYLGVASPTAAQTASATKAIIRVLRSMFRD